MEATFMLIEFELRRQCEEIGHRIKQNFVVRLLSSIVLEGSEGIIIAF